MPTDNMQMASQVMDPRIVFIDGLATARDAVQAMKREKVNALIVNKRNDRDVYGIVRLRDIISGVVIPDRTSQEVNVFEIMVKPTITVPADMDVKYVARLFIRLDLWEAPVEREGNLIGMISLSDIIRNIALD